jgi:hypothetical protein
VLARIKDLAQLCRKLCTLFDVCPSRRRRRRRRRTWQVFRPVATRSDCAENTYLKVIILSTDTHTRPIEKDNFTNQRQQNQRGGKTDSSIGVLARKTQRSGWF